ncbi:MAG TPA: Ig-like domain-containing protein [Candidatus Angelobacter sp.]
MKSHVKAILLVLLCCSSCWGAITIDAIASGDSSSASTRIASQAFSTTSANELLLAFVSTDAKSAGITVTGVTGGGLTWSLVKRANAQLGTSEIWRAFAPATLANATVTATLSQSVAASITVVSFSGVDTSGTGGSGAIGATAAASSASGAPSASLITTRANSWVFGVGNDFDNAISRTPAAGQTIIHQFLPTIGDTYWMQRQNSPTANSGTQVFINDSAPTGDRYNLAICEILPPSVPVPDTTPPSVSISAPANNSVLTGTKTVTASATDNVAIASVQLLLDGNPFGLPLTTAPYTAQWDTTTAIPGPHAWAATATDTANNQATSAAITVTVDNTAPQVSITAPANGSNVTGAATLTANATDNTSVAGVQFLLDGANLGAEVTTAPYSMSWSSATVANGQHSLSARARDAAGLTTTSQAITVNVANAVAAAPAVDAVAFGDLSSSSTTIRTSAFSTTASNEVLLAFIASDAVSGTITVQSVSGGGLTWNLVSRTNVQPGTSEVWRAFAPTVLSQITVTATMAASTPAGSITVVSFTGADTSGINASGAIGAIGSGSSPAGAPVATLKTVRNNSLVLGVGNDFSNAIARTLGPNQTMVHQFLSPTGDTYWVQRQGAPIALSGTTVNINDTAPSGDQYNLSIVEVLAPGTGGGSNTPPSVSMIAPAANATATGRTTIAANATDQLAVAGVQFLLDGNALGPEITISPWSMTWDTTAATAGAHTLSAIARNTSGLTTTAAAVSVTVDNSGNPAVVGSWSTPVTIPTVAVNLILTGNNKLLFYEDGASPTLWDYISNTFTNVPANANLFCSGHAILADGRVLAVGGFGGSGTQIGIPNAEIFDPSNNTWTAVPKMGFSRWYPTATTLSDGRVLVTAGWQTSPHTNAGIPEIYDPATNRWTQLTNANNPFETYPFIFQLGDGRVLHVGGTEFPTSTEALDLTTQTWTAVDPRVIDGGSATMYLPGKIMKAGSATDSQGTGPSSNTTFVLDMSQPSPAWSQTPAMAYPRSFLNLTTLPDGSVLATGGETDRNGGIIGNAIFAAEMWSPQNQTWTTMASMHTPREYHSTALLLPDGRVVQSGMGADFGQVPDQMTAEFYSPPYLFKGARPTIAQAPTVIHYGQGFVVGTPDAAGIAKVVLIRTGAVTHFFDQNTHYVPLTFGQTTGGLSLTAPANGNLAPPGYYMLFLVNNNGVPSVASMVQLLP